MVPAERSAAKPGDAPAGRSWRSGGGSGACWGCKSPSHRLADCPEAKPKGVACTKVLLPESMVTGKQPLVDGMGRSKDPDFGPFRSEGAVAVSEEGEQVPVEVLRDTGAGQTLVRQGAVSFIDECLTGEYTLLGSIGGAVVAPLARLFLRTALVTGMVTVAVRESLPAEGVDVLLGNDLCGEKVFPEPIVCEIPLESDPAEEILKDNPSLFPVCAVTRSMAKEQVSVPAMHSDAPHVDDEWGLVGLFDEIVDENGKYVGLNRDKLIECVASDETLTGVLARAMTHEEIGGEGKDTTRRMDC